MITITNHYDPSVPADEWDLTREEQEARAWRRTCEFADLMNKEFPEAPIPGTQLPGAATVPMGFHVRNQEESDRPFVMMIYTHVGAGGVTAEDFALALADIPRNREILVCINSGGGSVFEGLAIHNNLAARRDKVTVHVDGIAASIASVIALAGRELIAPANSTIMIHDPSGAIEGNAADVRKYADILDHCKERIANVYTGKTKKPTSLIYEKMSAETWMSGEEARAFGFVDRVTSDITAHFDLSKVDLSKYRNVPSNLRAA